MLLAAFTAALAAALLRGRAPACHCFGELSSAPAGPWTLARNGALLAAAAVVTLAGPGDSALTPVVALAAALTATLATATAVVLRTLRAHGHALRRIDQLEDALRAAGAAVPGAEPLAAATGLAPGTPAPQLATLALPAERPALLVFTDPHCAPCRTLEPDLAAWRDRDDVEILAVTARAGGPGDGDALVDGDRRIFAAYGAGATPAAVLVGVDGRVAARLAMGPDAIRALVRRHLDGPPLTVVQVPA